VLLSFRLFVFKAARRRSSHHAGGAPDVGRRVVGSADQNLHGAVLTRLDVVSEVFVLTARRDDSLERPPLRHLRL